VAECGTVAWIKPGSQRRRERLVGAPSVVSFVLLPPAGGDLRVYRRMRRLLRQPTARCASSNPGHRGLARHATGTRGRVAFRAGPLVPSRCDDLLHVAVLHDPHEERLTAAANQPGAAAVPEWRCKIRASDDQSGGRMPARPGRWRLPRQPIAPDGSALVYAARLSDSTGGSCGQYRHVINRRYYQFLPARRSRQATPDAG
jgi:hypothetical protein